MESVHTRCFFWLAFSCIWTEYGDLLRKYPYSVRVEENGEMNKIRIWTLFTQWHLSLIVTDYFIMDLVAYRPPVSYQLNVLENQLWKYLGLFSSVFPAIWTEYGEIQSFSPYSVRMRENTEQKISEYGNFSRSADHAQWWSCRYLCCI